jgi:2'-5' RNA ligase
MSRSAAHSMYYIAILCPPEIDKEVLGYKRWMKERFGCIAALRSPAHVTLVPPFWLQEEKEMDLRQICESFTSNIDELAIQVRGFSHFDMKVLYAVVTGNTAIEELKNQVETHLISFFDAIKKDERPFHPHITIATRDLKPSDFMEAWAHFLGKEFIADFTTRTISLLKLSAGKWNVITQKNW